MRKLVLCLMTLSIFLAVSVPAAAVDNTVVAEEGNFRLVRIEYSNQDLLTYSVTRKVTEGILIYSCPGYDKENQPPLAKRLFEIRGVTAVHLSPYQVKVFVATPAFDKDKLRHEVERAILARYGVKVKSAK